MMPGEFNLRQLLTALPTYIFIGLLVASRFSIVLALIIAAIIVIMAVSLTLASNVWRGIAYRLTERGFI